MPDEAEVCGCNGVTKGTICKAIKEKGLFTIDEVKKHTWPAPSCGFCTASGADPDVHAGGDYSAAPEKKALYGCTDHSHQECATRSRPTSC